MFNPKTVVNFEGFLLRELRFLRKKSRFTDQIYKTRYFSTCFCFTFCFSILQKKSERGMQGTFLERWKLWKSRLPSQLHNSPVSKCNLQKPCSVSKDKKTTFAKFCSKNSIKKRLVVPEFHTFLIVFTRIARNVINLNATLTTVSGKRLCTKQILTKPDTAKKSTKQTKFQFFHSHMSSNLSLHLLTALQRKNVGPTCEKSHHTTCCR